MKTDRKLKYGMIVLVILILASLLTNCASPATQIPSTETAPPSETPLPTSTFTPEPSLTLPPTSTPDVKATNNAVATQVVNKRLDIMKPDLDLVGYPESGTLAWYQLDPISLVPRVNGSLYYELIDEDLLAADFIFKTDITWSATSLVVCGFGYRAEQNISAGSFYEFLFERISGLPGWIINYYEDGEVVSTISGDVHYSEALNTENNATNTFILVAKGNEFTVYINGVRQGSFYDYGNNLAEGQFILLYFQDSGKSECKFSNSWIWVYE